MQPRTVLTAFFVLLLVNLSFAQAPGIDHRINDQSTQDQQQVELDIAHNGWIYAAHTVTEGNKGGIVYRCSKDNGVTWTTLYSSLVANSRIKYFQVIAAGKFHSWMRSFLFVVQENTQTQESSIAVYSFNGITLQPIGNPYLESFPASATITGFSAASDKIIPAEYISTYSLAIAYSVNISGSSQIRYRLSADGGLSFEQNQLTIASSTAWLRNVHLAFGRSGIGSNGRYMAVWEEASSAAAAYAAIRYTRNNTNIRSEFLPSIQLDTIGGRTGNQARHPRIAASSTMLDNDSSSVTAIVLAEYAGGGSQQIVGFYNMRAHYTNEWYPSNISEEGSWPDLVYDSANFSFHATYLDQTGQQLVGRNISYNLRPTTAWSMEYANYADTVSGLSIARPRVTMDPRYRLPAYGWAASMNGLGVAYVDPGINTGKLKQTLSWQLQTEEGVAEGIYGDEPVNGAAMASSGLTPTYSSSDPEVASVTADGSVSIRKVGSAVITASQEGNSSYNPAIPINFMLQIEPKVLTVIAENSDRPFGEANPDLVIRYEGFVPGDDVSSLSEEPILWTEAETATEMGQYPIYVIGGWAENYYVEPVNGLLTIGGANLTITGQPADTAVCGNQSALFNAVATATSPLVNVSYQWQISEDGQGNWQDIDGATNAQLNLSPAQALVSNDKWFQCKISVTGTTSTTRPAQLSGKAVMPVDLLVPDEVCVDDKTLGLSASITGGVFSGTGISGNTWDLQIPAAGPQTLTYTYTDSDGCEGELTKTVQLKVCGDELIEVMGVYPNPNRGRATVKILLREQPGQWQFTLTSMHGQLAANRAITLRVGWNQFELDMQQLAAGVYVLSAYTGNSKKKHIKVMKQ
ncbi:MAG: MBG domain-containing protein [Candidatus Pseudobacter hemicellulosilyticus]|uniref:MBG domain-containing protein n=1 Tax=Candidatus Pseudobacter hemicellulosilyticus TaxID=3121375 RepID=A0AAJ5WKN0_9BACT|nr:MAG: MBG domain-containing protein [Pseudobacter sp.]